MKFLGKIEELKKENEDRILLARCGVFMIAIGKDAIFLSEKFGFKKTCFRELEKGKIIIIQGKLNTLGEVELEEFF